MTRPTKMSESADNIVRRRRFEPEGLAHSDWHRPTEDHPPVPPDAKPCEFAKRPPSTGDEHSDWEAARNSSMRWARPEDMDIGVPLWCLACAWCAMCAYTFWPDDHSSVCAWSIRGCIPKEACSLTWDWDSPIPQCVLT